MQQNFSATSELETEIEAILKETGLEEDEVRKREDRELKQNMFTKEEVLQRQQDQGLVTIQSWQKPASSSAWRTSRRRAQPRCRGRQP